MSRLHRKKTRLGVIGLAGVFLITLGLAAASLIWNARQTALTHSEAEAIRFVSGAEAALNRSLLGVDVLLASTDDLLGLSNSLADWIDTTTANRLLRVSTQQNLLVRLTVLLDAQGQVLASSNQSGADLTVKLPAGFLDQALSPAVSTLTISAPTLSFASAEQVLYLARFIKLADGARVVAVAELPVALLNTILVQGVDIKGLQVTLERSAGQLLASVPNQIPPVIAAQAAPLGPWSSQRDNQVQRQPARLTGEDAIVVKRPTLYRDVLVVASIPIDAALRNWRVERDFIAGAALVFAIMILAASGFTLWYLNRLAQARRALAESKAEIEQLAFFDPLSGLPNRRLLMDRLQRALTTSARSGHYGALLFLDLDHFKTLNDTLGHHVGDLLLQEVAARLKACVREEDTVARLGGDEFVIMLEDLADRPHDAAALARRIGEKILLKLNQRYLLGLHDYHNTPSIGATLFGGANLAPSELLKQADIAMYQVKSQGRNALCFFDPQMQADITARAQLENDLHLALTEQQFELHYQPQITLAGRVVGAEVLIRWRHPLRGMVSPAEFIPAAEEGELILRIGHWVLSTACEQLARWQVSPTWCELQLSVNVSARQFRQASFVADVAGVLRDTGIRADLLKLELTESLVLDNVEDTIVKMGQLKTMGVHFSVDDFGTGHSSLSYLTRLPLDQLKIDQSFVRNIGIKPTDGVIVQTIIGMARNLGLEVIAEGVETQAQKDFLALHGCTVYQGYLLGRPTPLAAFETLLATA
jgi:diguanylate cyclase (GGDEF)-like protein